LRVFVFVLNKKGEPLMPTSPAKAKKLLNYYKSKYKTPWQN